MGFILGGHHLYYNTVYSPDLLVLHCISKQVTEAPMTATHGHGRCLPTTARNLPNTHTQPFPPFREHILNDSQKLPFPQTLSLHPSFPRMAYIGLAYCLWNPTLFSSPLVQDTQDPISKAASKGSVLGDVRDGREKLLTLDAVSHGSQTTVENLSGSAFSINYMEGGKAILSDCWKRREQGSVRQTELGLRAPKFHSMYIPMRNENMCPPQNTYPNVYSNITHSISKIKTVKFPCMDEWIKHYIPVQREIIQQSKRTKYGSMLQHQWTWKTLC